MTALVSLCVGLLLSSTVWLIVSLVASVVAGLLIYRNREFFAISRPPRAKRPATAKHADDADQTGVDAVPASVSASKRPDPDVWVVDGRPRYHRAGCQIIGDQDAETIPLSQASEDGFIPCSLCEPDRIDAVA
ncbi:MAG TPA: hypothetical protein VE074_16655 [Jatrophihabitantaceae bacterium]|nr:hypothetical protein [Jatrophihabitantaceae bacterium]